MDTMRIVLANEPRSYREVIAAAVRQLRPQHEVITVAPDDLDAEIVRLDPQLVLCSRPTPAVQTYPIAWVLLYPDGETWAAIHMDGRRTTVLDLEFNRLLAIVDQMEQQPQLREGKPAVSREALTKDCWRHC